MDDILRQNPDLMRQFQSAAVNSMGESNPGFSGFMGGMMGQGQGPPPMTTQGQGPPPPMTTQGPNGLQPPTNRAGNNMESMNINSSMKRGAFTDDGISIKESNIGVPGFQPPQQSQKSARRPDMKGPTDISVILSGLKTKTVDISSVPAKNGSMETNTQQHN